MVTFPENLRNLREKNKISLRKLADDLNFSHSAVSLWENGKRKPNFEILEKLANYFNVSINELLGITETQNNSNVITDNLTEEQQILLEKIKTLDNMQFKQVSTFVDKVIALDKEQEQMVKILISEKYKNKNIDNN